MLKPRRNPKPAKLRIPSKQFTSDPLAYITEFDRLNRLKPAAYNREFYLSAVEKTYDKA